MEYRWLGIAVWNEAEAARHDEHTVETATGFMGLGGVTAAYAYTPSAVLPLKWRQGHRRDRGQ